MRLLKVTDDGDFSLTKDLISNIPKYAILSHTWAAAEEDEVTCDDLMRGQGRTKSGYHKVRFCAEKATDDKLQHLWIDTCCIDRSNSAELSEAITSMFRWYRSASICYVYLADVTIAACDKPNQASWEPLFRRSKW